MLLATALVVIIKVWCQVSMLRVCTYTRTEIIPLARSPHSDSDDIPDSSTSISSSLVAYQTSKDTN